MHQLAINRIVAEFNGDALKAISMDYRIGANNSSWIAQNNDPKLQYFKGLLESKLNIGIGLWGAAGKINDLEQKCKSVMDSFEEYLKTNKQKENNFSHLPPISLNRPCSEQKKETIARSAKSKNAKIALESATIRVTEDSEYEEETLGYSSECFLEDQNTAVTNRRKKKEINQFPKCYFTGQDLRNGEDAKKDLQNLIENTKKELLIWSFSIADGVLTPPIAKKIIAICNEKLKTKN